MYDLVHMGDSLWKYFTWVAAWNAIECFPEVWKILDSKFFTLPQRRHCVWGVACLNAGGQSVDSLSGLYSSSLDSMRTNFQFPLHVNFPAAPEEPVQSGRHQDHVDDAILQAFGATNLYVDCQGSSGRRVVAHGVLPCLTASHPIYSVELGRYMRGEDMLNGQGLWASAMSKEVREEILSEPKLAHDLAGNSFSSTVCQAVFIACLISGTDALPSMLSLHRDNPLRRIRKKRPAPEFPEVKDKPRKRKRKYARKGLDNKNKGKKPMASIMAKEKL